MVWEFQFTVRIYASLRTDFYFLRFTSDHYTFSVSFKVRHVMGGLIMTSIEYTENRLFLTLMGIEPGPSQIGVGYSNHSTKALTFYIKSAETLIAEIDHSF